MNITDQLNRACAAKIREEELIPGFTLFKLTDDEAAALIAARVAEATAEATEEAHQRLDRPEVAIIRNAKDGYPDEREDRVLTLAERTDALIKMKQYYKRWMEKAEADRDRLAAELTEAKACLGYSVPGDFVPRFGLKCGICEATRGREEQLRAYLKAHHEIENQLVEERRALRAEINEWRDFFLCEGTVVGDGSQLGPSESHRCWCEQRDQLRAEVERLETKLRQPISDFSAAPSPDGEPYVTQGSALPCGMTLVPDAEIAALRTDRTNLIGLLRYAKCPDCDGSGTIWRQSLDDVSADQEQCRWCFERNAAFTAKEIPRMNVSPPKDVLFTKETK